MVAGSAELSQMRRGLLPYCVLASLHGGPRYGFELIRLLAGVDGMVTSEGTIYPLLSRLRREGLVDTTWVPSDAGPPRRYYALTPAGRRALAAFTTEWARLRAGVDHFLAISEAAP